MPIEELNDRLDLFAEKNMRNLILETIAFLLEVSDNNKRTLSFSTCLGLKENCKFVESIHVDKVKKRNF